MLGKGFAAQPVWWLQKSLGTGACDVTGLVGLHGSNPTWCCCGLLSELLWTWMTLDIVSKCVAQAELWLVIPASAAWQQQAAKYSKAVVPSVAFVKASSLPKYIMHYGNKTQPGFCLTIVWETLACTDFLPKRCYSTAFMAFSWLHICKKLWLLSKGTWGFHSHS